MPRRTAARTIVRRVVFTLPMASPDAHPYDTLVGTASSTGARRTPRPGFPVSAGGRRIGSLRGRLREAIPLSGMRQARGGGRETHLMRILAGSAPRVRGPGAVPDLAATQLNRANGTGNVVSREIFHVSVAGLPVQPVRQPTRGHARRLRSESGPAEKESHRCWGLNRANYQHARESQKTLCLRDLRGPLALTRAWCAR